MKTSGIISWLRSGRITIIMLIIVSFWLPLSKSILPVLFALTFLFFLIQKKRSFKYKDIRSEKLLILVIVFYVVHIISLIYSSNLNRALFDIEVKLSILIFPIIFLFLKLKDLDKLRNKMFNAFIIGNLIASVVCISIAFYNSAKNGNGELLNISLWTNTRDWPAWKLIVSGYSYFNYTWFSYFHHPSYFGMYLVFAAYLAFFYLKKSYSRLLKLKTAFYVFALVLFSIMIFLLQSRAVILTAIVVIVFELGRTIYLSKGHFTVKLIIASLTIGIILIFALSNERFKPFNSTVADKSEVEMKSANIRIEIWRKSAEIIKENFLFGVGTGDVKGELIRNYNTPSLAEAKEKGFNAHNQFIETTLGLGFIGFIVLIAILFLPFFDKANFDNSPVKIILLIIIITGFVFESMLNTLAGVSFFGLFYSLLYRKEL
ncbi:MAG: O-antigen ligase family protein [Bacteroidales bacterium]|nr:O-antigen ligase family protein [Bacteroidales bacterium]